jgi:hypothetical protein
LAHPTRFERVTFAFGGQLNRVKCAWLLSNADAQKSPKIQPIMKNTIRR